MSTALALREVTMPFSDIERLADSIAKSNLFGIKTKDQALALMLISQAEGRHPALAARDYDIIQGRPAKKAEAMLRDFLDAGGTVVWNALDDTIADATFSHPSGGTVRISWDMARATQAQLSGKDMYKKFPRQMLRSRTVSEGVRTVWPLATGGMYVTEEVADFAGPTIEAEPEIEPPPSRRDTINAETPLRAAATAMPRAPTVRAPAPETNGKVRHSIAPPPGAPDEAWRACLDKVGPGLTKLRTLELIEATAAGPTCGDIMQHGPDWAKAELADLLAENYARFKAIENAPEFAPAAAEAELPEVRIVGEERLAAGD